ncbi:hypothetical protein [Streptomyces sp. N2A]|uniref:hypothetical protein n=1 Tax=Streptomyces sp. N2A TaxID=3073936 RepID=UPI0028708FE6|nr:hypothetical protein [Streptomyces sp. N2A]
MKLRRALTAVLATALLAPAALLTTPAAAATGTPGVSTELLALPRTVAVGSGWHGFADVVRNTTDGTLPAVTLSLTGTAPVTVQFFDNAAGGTWHTVDLHKGRFLRYADLMPGEYLSKPMRLKLKAGARPGGRATLTALATFCDDHGACGVSAPRSYAIKITAKGTRQERQEGPGPTRACAPPRRAAARCPSGRGSAHRRPC